MEPQPGHSVHRNTSPFPIDISGTINGSFRRKSPQMRHRRAVPAAV
jgi:hypothetical protein